MKTETGTMAKTRAFIKIISAIALSIIFMWLMPNGTFDPTNYLFYVQIISAFVIVYLTAFIIDKYRTK